MTRGKLIRVSRVARWSAATVGFLLLLQSSTAAVIVPLNFGRDANAPAENQTLTFSADASGQVTVRGGGVVFNAVSKKTESFAFTRPFTHDGEIVSDWAPIQTSPRSYTSVSGGSAGVSHFGTDLTLQGLDHFQFDFGSGIDVPLKTILLTTNSSVALLKSIPIDLTMSFSPNPVVFRQGGDAIITGSNGFGTFQIPGTLSSPNRTFDAIIAELVALEMGDLPIMPVVFEGTWTIVSMGNQHKLSLDGTMEWVLAQSLTDLATEISIADPIALTMSVSSTAAFSFAMSAAVHLEQTFTAPEPGSIVLLGIGLAAMAAAIGHSKGRRKSG